MATPSAEQLMALPPEYLAEVNPTSQQLYNTVLGFVVIDTLTFSMFLISVCFYHNKIGLDVYLFMPLGYLCVLGNAIVGLCK